ncbi:MAG TPA: ATP-binding protein [Anaerolineaceae bacterium]|nr:ATP-binding protein [Anaerolineaceae bacterium]HOV06756.1 ATP-binding protein [Anaerolineaceae bacterium]
MNPQESRFNLNISDPENSVIGYVIGGGLKANLFVRLTVPAYEVQEGGFVVLESGNWQFYGLVTDLQLGALDPRYAEMQNAGRLSDSITRRLTSQTLYTNLEVLPALMLERGPEPGTAEYERWRKSLLQEPHPIPIKTVPAHHAAVRLASAGDVAEIFGNPQEKGKFEIGRTREQDHPVCIDLDKFVQRSSGIFGATGTGKSFLTRILLAGLIQHNAASVLILDMHNEYGFDDTASDTGKSVVGLRSKFPGRVRVVGLGRETKIRNHTPDFHLEIHESDIQPEDIELLTRELNLRETTPTTLDALVHHFGPQNWFREFRQMVVGSVVETDDGKKTPAPDSVAFWAKQAGVNETAAEGLRSKLTRVFNRKYILPDEEKAPLNSLREIIELLRNGKDVVLSFGDFESDLDYLLVSNLLTRKIREAWEEMTNNFRGKGEKEPRPLVIAVEEAHKILNREMASQTTFSTIAREMRKYYVTLLIIDQRPSQISDEVMSQLGTRVSGWLGDENDIAAVLSGLAGRDALRGMLARLQPKEEVLLLGWGVPMPILVRSRRYDEVFWQQLLGKDDRLTDDQAMKDLGY